MIAQNIINIANSNTLEKATARIEAYTIHSFGKAILFTKLLYLIIDNIDAPVVAENRRHRHIPISIYKGKFCIDFIQSEKITYSTQKCIRGYNNVHKKPKNVP